MSKEGFKTEIIKMYDKNNNVDVLIHDGHGTIIEKKNFYEFKYGRIRSPYYMSEHIHNSRWMTIEGCDNYAVSDMGYVKNITTNRILKHQIDSSGYYSNAISDNQKNRKTVSVHRLVAQAFIPNPENKREVNHIDGDKSNNKVCNLEWATRWENLNHAYTTGLFGTDQNHSGGKRSGKLSREQVRAIFIDNRSNSEIAKEYDCSIMHVSNIRNKKRRQCDTKDLW